MVEEIEVPAIQPTSVMFGGKNMTTLFVTSACEGGKDLRRGLDEQGNFLGGTIFQKSLLRKGRLEWLAEL